MSTKNPIIWSDVPDLDIIRVGDCYYMVSTTMYFTPVAPIMKSYDLVEWKICSYVAERYEDGDVQNLANGKNDYSRGQWATSLRYANGGFYVFFGSLGSGKSYIYTSDDAEKSGWERHVIDGYYHDASMLFDTDGRNYLVYGGGGEIKLRELDETATAFKEGASERSLFKTGLDGLSGEGSHAYRLGDYYYIFLIAWPRGSRRVEYCYRAKELNGEWEGRKILDSSLGSYPAGVAQGGFTDTPDGDYFALLFEDHGAVGRVPVLVPMRWEEGWPVLGEDEKAPLTLAIEGERSEGHMLPHGFTDENGRLAYQWQWNHNPDASSYGFDGGRLRLYAKHKATNIFAARNTLTCRTVGPSCTFTVKLDASRMKEGDRAGLSAFEYDYGNIGVSVKGGEKFLYMSRNGGMTDRNILNCREEIVEELPLVSDEVYLRIEFVFAEADDPAADIDEAVFLYGFDGESFTAVGENLKLRYDLRLFTGCRAALYCYPTEQTGGFAEFSELSGHM